MVILDEDQQQVQNRLRFVRASVIIKYVKYFIFSLNQVAYLVEDSLNLIE